MSHDNPPDGTAGDDPTPDAHTYDAMGPFYDAESLCQWLNITTQDLRQRQLTHRILAIPLRDGTEVYPVWQFTTAGEPVPGLAGVLAVLLAATDPWTAAIWLTTEHDEFGGASAVHALTTSDGSDARVFEAARRDAARWRT